MSYLRCLCLFACGGVQHISCCVFISPLHQMGGGGVRYSVFPLSILLSVPDIFRRIFLSNY